MATTVLPNDDLHNNADDKHLEIFGLIWLDANVKETRDTEQKLRSIINHLKKFQDVNQCQQYVDQRSQKDRLILIVSGRLGREIVPSIHKLRQVISIYVYCIDKKSNEQWACKFPKVKAVVVELDELVSRIKADHKIQKKVEEPLSINIFSTGGKSTTGVNGQFVFSQVLIDCLLQLKSSQTDKNELIHVCTNEYEGNHDELNNLREFRQDYSSDKVLWWYTRESFFYKTLNAALRTQNIHMIFLFRKYICDIHRQLQRCQTKHSLRVYRSQKMSSDELKTLEQSLGQFISVNSFFSTSTDYLKALSFLDISDTSGDLERVLFEIDANPKMVTTKPFADISAHSDFSDESEVLFMIGSIFRLQSINRNKDQVWIIRMILCSDDEHDLKEVLLDMKKQTGSGETNLRTLGKLLWDMGKLDLAENYFNRLLTELPLNDPLRGSLYKDLGKLASQTGQLDMSIEWRQKSLAFEKQNELTVNPNINKSNNSTTTPLRGSSIDIHPNARWQQNGLTVAGGHGRGNEINQLYKPWGLYVDDDQTVYIADTYNHRIVKWKWGATSGQVVAGGNERGREAHQLSNPYDVIVDKERDSLIICDRNNRRVVRWPRRNRISGETIISNIDCWGLAMDENGSLYVTDVGKHEVRRYRRAESEGTVVAGGDGRGNRLDQLSIPHYVFVDRDHSVYVSDYGNARVMKWMEGAKEGIVVAGGQGRGNGLTHLSDPQGVVVDQLGTVYVADDGNDRIMRWFNGATQGSVIMGGNGRGGQSNQLNQPIGLSFDRQDNLYVVDYGNHRVQKFNIEKS